MRERLESGLEKRRDNRFFENRMELTWGERHIDRVVMVGVRTEAHIFRSQVGIGSESDCLLGQLKRILDISYSDAGLKVQLEGRVSVGEVEVLLVREIWSLEILSVEKLAKLSAREEPGVDVGKGEEYLRWSRLLTVFHRRFGLSETEETKLEKTGKWSDGEKWLEKRLGAREVSEEVMTKSRVWFLLWVRKLTCWDKLKEERRVKNLEERLSKALSR